MLCRASSKDKKWNFKGKKSSRRIILEVSDCDILRHHDSRIMTYHDCENYHDCHILQTFGTNKQAVVYKILSNTCHCTISMVVESCSTHYKCYWNKEIYKS